MHLLYFGDFKHLYLFIHVILINLFIPGNWSILGVFQGSRTAFPGWCWRRMWPSWWCGPYRWKPAAKRSTDPPGTATPWRSGVASCLRSSKGVRQQLERKALREVDLEEVEFCCHWSVLISFLSLFFSAVIERGIWVLLRLKGKVLVKGWNFTVTEDVLSVFLSLSSWQWWKGRCFRGSVCEEYFWSILVEVLRESISESWNFTITEVFCLYFLDNDGKAGF